MDESKWEDGSCLLEITEAIASNERLIRADTLTAQRLLDAEFIATCEANYFIRSMVGSVNQN
jgi:hypothetical protein